MQLSYLTYEINKSQVKPEQSYELMNQTSHLNPEQSYELNKVHVNPEQGYELNKGHMNPEQGYDINKGHVNPEQGYKLNKVMKHCCRIICYWIVEQGGVAVLP